MIPDLPPAALGIPEGWRALGTIALGHPAPDEPGRSAKRPRRTVDEVLTIGRTEMTFFDPTQNPPAMLRPGDMLRLRIERIIR